MTDNKSAGRTETGVEMTDDVLNRMAQEAGGGSRSGPIGSRWIIDGACEKGYTHLESLRR